MSNTNITTQAQYNVNDAWSIDEPTTADDCLKKLVRLSQSGKVIECHGVDKIYNCICSTFDIRFVNGNNVQTKRPKDVEKELLKSFVEEADPHFSPEARRFIEVARLKWDTLYNTGTVFVGRHYHLPTRCVDWTTDSLIALFFACWRYLDEPGVVWWMYYDDFSNALKTQWWPAYNKEGKIADDFEKDFTEDKDKDILIRYHYNPLLDRPEKQKAHIILSGLYNVHHDQKIYHLGVRNCGRIVIKSQIKFDLLGKLNRLGINSTTLGIEDSYVDTIATDIANKVLGKNI
jgi:hypothetical protein